MCSSLIDAEHEHHQNFTGLITLLLEKEKKETFVILLFEFHVRGNRAFTKWPL